MTESLRELALEAYDRVISLQLGAVAVDGCITKAPGGENTLEELGPLPERVSVHLDRGYDSDATRKRLEKRGLNGVISEKEACSVGRRTTSGHRAYQLLAQCFQDARLMYQAPGEGHKHLDRLLGRDHHGA